MRTSLKISLSLLIVIPAHLFSGGMAFADTSSCPNSICITVTTDPTSGKIIISGKKQVPGVRSGAVTTQPLPVKRVITKPKPAVTYVKPKPTAPTRVRTQNTRTVYTAPVHRSAPIHRSAPVHRTPIVKKKISTTSGISLSDQISQLIPGGGIYTTPAAFPLVNTPITIWSSTPSNFSTTSLILGVPVQLFLTPTFTWNFGDGSTLTTHDGGAPYPHGEITHQFHHEGNYLITLQVSWWGSWIANNITTPLLGGSILNTFQYPITAIAAPSRFIS